MKKEEIQNLIAQMTLEEKAGMCSGADFWQLKSIKRLGIPPVKVTDGPHGLRAQDEQADQLGINESIKAVCFPTGCATASSFDRKLLKKMGTAIGQECQAKDISTILGPAMNIKRSPLCGRNFEYYSEDPLVASEMAAALTEGVQSQNVGVSMKHFLANNQERRRMTNSSQVDERTLREIYLAAFEGAVKQAKPWTVMNSYNRINGTYVGESKEYLTDILRDEWGFDGYVMSDWGAVNDRVEALKAGMDLEMPASGGINDALIVKAVQDRNLNEKIVDQACERILTIIFKFAENRQQNAVFEYEKDHELAAEAAAECIVLLKNEDDLLPLAKDKKVAFIGKYAETPRYQGGGSSHINSWKVESAVEVVQEIAEVSFAKGFDDAEDDVNEKLQQEAVRIAEEAEAAVIFAGLPDNFESEGYDRTHLNLPNCQNTLIEKICKVQKNTIVVLHNGSPVTMPWKDHVKGIVEAYLGGQAVGKAVVNVLYGNVNPSGRLAETFPLRLEDTPCYLTYGKGMDEAVYSEGVFVGYRYYTSKKQEVLFPFGYGLSYTTFTYSNLNLDKTQMADTEILTVSVDVENTGTRTGKEVVQIYVAPGETETARPLKELRAFDKIELAPGEKKTVTFELDARAFAYWNTEIHDWYVESGAYEIQVGKNAEEVLLHTSIQVKGTKKIKKTYTLNTCIGELMQDEKGKVVFGQMMGSNKQATEMAESNQANEVINDEMMAAIMNDMPLRQLLSFVPGMTREALEQILAAVNQ
ncbi:glycoside hydrolase family 3 C-terminal domain-containing protein [Mediterraneibacter gnavus]|uniref:glycoside hydrolase family 3 C-terminal domain-containing protein n=1 Tax=Mediterraneibacter gnavus TaxID=33038 RepID=UPI00232B41C9|nr:glycoside hydrolase family 3 C-terminal domain-containing protein [Mediterraneibacter gnavus]MDB8709940.1 glycoside hydrolase family 3 C-terminal domain-containing protein [Mediterraneibacter gnavus]MDB8712892.1 glycoside hydrolase family 3 C-terminal domain-containing protein [Mediterraneibacter gnavus]